MIHLQGARTIVHGACVTGATDSEAFLLDWFAYHDVLQNYTRCHGSGMEQSPTNMVMQLPGVRNSQVSDLVQPLYCLLCSSLQVIGLLGCSREVLYLIASINHLRSLPQALRAQQVEIANSVRDQLQHLQQEVLITTGVTAGIVDVQRISLTADFYRKAAQLYLEQVMPGQHMQDHYIEDLVNDCFTLLDQLGLCTSPWPLFVLANWCVEDEHRIKILAILEAMNHERRIGNVEVVETIVRALWRRIDLRAPDKKFHDIDWRDLVDTNEFMPSFI